MAADLGGFTDVLLLVGLAAGLVWWYYNKPTPKVEQKTGKKPGEKKEDGAPAASVTPVINIIFQSDGLIALYREIGTTLIGVGFVCAGLAVLKKLISNHERTKEAIITYIVALITWLLIWQLI